MSDIPDDIRDAAIAAYEDCEPNDNAIIAAIARAIADERERCAQIADKFSGVNYEARTRMVAWNIALGIRTPTEGST